MNASQPAQDRRRDEARRAEFDARLAEFAARLRQGPKLPAGLPDSLAGAIGLSLAASQRPPIDAWDYTKGRRPQTREDALDELIAERADAIANGLDYAEWSSLIDWQAIRVSYGGESIDYFEAADRAQTMAARGDAIGAVTLLVARRGALIDYLLNWNVLRGDCADELLAQAAAIIEPDYRDA